MLIKTPSIVQRKPRKLNTIKYWKATEFLYWLLFYSPTVLLDILPKKFYNHWILLVVSMYCLLDESISEKKLALVEYLLIKFVLNTGKIYGPEHVTYNVHILLHIPECVRNWGMLWNYSNFLFESFNGTLKRFVYGSQNAGHQIAQRFLIHQFIKGFSSSAKFYNLEAEKFFQTLIQGYDLKKIFFLKQSVISKKSLDIKTSQSNSIFFPI